MNWSSFTDDRGGEKTIGYWDYQSTDRVGGGKNRKHGRPMQKSSVCPSVTVNLVRLGQALVSDSWKPLCSWKGCSLVPNPVLIRRILDWCTCLIVIRHQRMNCPIPRQSRNASKEVNADWELSQCFAGDCYWHKSRQCNGFRAIYSTNDSRRQHWLEYDFQFLINNLPLLDCV